MNILFHDNVRNRKVVYNVETKNTFVVVNSDMNTMEVRPHLTLKFLIENEYFHTNDSMIITVRRIFKYLGIT